jgi:hypothetical protein
MSDRRSTGWAVSQRRLVTKGMWTNVAVVALSGVLDCANAVCETLEGSCMVFTVRSSGRAIAFN